MNTVIRKQPRLSFQALGPLERRVMEIVWSLDEATVREVAARLGGEDGPAYTTVMTVMSRLVDKALLHRAFRGRAYVYRPACTRDELVMEASRAMVHSLVKDFGSPAVARFVEELGASDPERVRRLAALASEVRAEDDDGQR